MFESFSAGMGITYMPEYTKPSSNGVVYYDGYHRKFKIVDIHSGSSTDIYPIQQVISLDENTRNILAWAQSKMAEEQLLKTQLEHNAAAKEAYDHLQLLLTLTK